MFADLVLPFGLSLLVCGILGLWIIWASRRWGWHGVRSIALAGGVAVILVIPACVGIGLVLEPIRHGEARYERPTDIRWLRGKAWVPPHAQRIHLVSHASGFVARFAISGTDAEAFVAGLWEQRGLARPATGAWEASMGIPPDEFIDFMGVPAALRDPPLPGFPWFSLESPRALNGAGFTLWFHPGSGEAIQRAGYW